MDGLFSKASSFLNSQAEHEAPPASTHGEKGNNGDEKTRQPAHSGGYADLLAGAQTLMNSAKPSDDGESVDKEGKFHKSPASSGGYGDLLASAQAMMGSAKLSSGEGTPEDKKGAIHNPTASSGDSGYGDMYASAQVLMGAAKASREGRAADMGEVAGATADLIGAASRYGNIDKTTYGEYAHKAQTYLQDYEASHSKTPPQDVGKPKEEESNTPPISKPQETPLRSSAGSEEEYNS